MKQTASKILSLIRDNLYQNPEIDHTSNISYDSNKLSDKVSFYINGERSVSEFRITVENLKIPEIETLTYLGKKYTVLETHNEAICIKAEGVIASKHGLHYVGVSCGDKVFNVKILSNDFVAFTQEKDSTNYCISRFAKKEDFDTKEPIEETMEETETETLEHLSKTHSILEEHDEAICLISRGAAASVINPCGTKSNIGVSGRISFGDKVFNVKVLSDGFIAFTRNPAKENLYVCEATKFGFHFREKEPIEEPIEPKHTLEYLGTSYNVVDFYDKAICISILGLNRNICMTKLGLATSFGLAKVINREFTLGDIVYNVKTLDDESVVFTLTSDSEEYWISEFPQMLGIPSDKETKKLKKITKEVFDLEIKLKNNLNKITRLK